MLKIYFANVQCLEKPSVFEGFFIHMNHIRQQKINRVKQLSDKRLSLGAGILLRYALEKEGLDYSKLDFEVSQNEKPIIVSNENDVIVYFNLSHSKNMVMCVISDKPVGCDIQENKDYKAGVAQKFFTAEEFEYLEGLPKEDRVRAFYRIWSLKESFVKMTGEGINRPFNSFELSLGRNASCKTEPNCIFAEYHNEFPGYSAACCYRGETNDICDVASTVSLENIYNNERKAWEKKHV